MRRLQVRHTNFLETRELESVHLIPHICPQFDISRNAARCTPGCAIEHNSRQQIRSTAYLDNDLYCYNVVLHYNPLEIEIVIH
jgi:hypothetical protein